MAEPRDRAGDPRPPPRDGSLGAEPSLDFRPAVSSARDGPTLILIIAGAAVLGLLVFLWLSSHRPPSSADADLTQPKSGASEAVLSAPPPPPALGAMEAAGRADRASAPRCGAHRPAAGAAASAPRCSSPIAGALGRQDPDSGGRSWGLKPLVLGSRSLARRGRDPRIQGWRSPYGRSQRPERG